MSTISLQISVQDDNLPLNLTGSNAVHSTPKVSLTGTLFEPAAPTPGTTLAAPGTTPTPDPTSAAFNYLGLPRVTSQPNLNLTTTAQLVVFINSVDHSKYAAGFSLAFPLNGITEGQLTLTGLPSNFSLAVGNIVEISQTFGSTTYKVAKVYIMANPILTTSEMGVNSMQLSIGCELGLFNEKARQKQRLYCGPLPTTAQQAAKIYAEYHGLLTRTFPVGHTLLDRDDQTFSSESPFQYLQALYAPTNQDVRCLPQGGIIAVPRPGFEPTSAIELAFKNVLEVDPTVSANYQQTFKVKASNQFTVIGDMSFRTETTKSVSSLPTNTKPFFQSGYTETTTTSVYLGDTLIHQTVVLMGYLPTTLPLSDADYKADPCTSTPIPTTWGLVQTTTFSLSYYLHTSGSYLVSKAQTWVNGKRPRQMLPATTWDLFDGVLEYTLETYENTPQINSQVCTKDFIHYLTAQRREYFKVDELFVYRLHQVDDIRFTPISSNPTSGNTFEGFSQEWQKTFSSGSYSETDKSFIIQPAVSTIENPPNSKWIRPPQRDGQVFSEFTDYLLSSPEADFGLPMSLEAPFVYTLAQLETYTRRWLLENNGLSQSIELVVPFHFQARLGQSIYYTNSLNQRLAYQVFNISLTQEGPDSYKTLLLARSDKVVQTVTVSPTPTAPEPPPSTPWSPILLSPAFWVNESAGTAGSWTDLSNNVRHAVQATTNRQPAIISAAQNGLAVRRFDGSNDGLQTAAFPLNTQFTVFLMAKSTTGTKFLLEHGANSNTSDGFFFAGTYANAWNVRRSGAIHAGPSNSGTDWSGTNYAVLGMTYTTNGNLYKDGVFVAGSDATHTGTTRSNSSISATLNIGTRNNSSNFFNGDIGEILVFSSALNTTEIDLVNGYLHHKWGLTANLPSGHPYKINPPLV